MAIVTLTTDWKLNDFYLGAVKGKIHALCNNVIIVDINHQIHPFNIAQGTFILRQSFQYFPKDTIHIFDVNSEVTNDLGYVVIKYLDHYFISANNGSLGLIISNEPQTAIKIEKFQSEDCLTFPALHVFAPAAAFIASGSKVEELGPKIENIERQTSLYPVIDEAVIVGSVIYIDSYNNLITNISKEIFHQVGKQRNFEILVQSNHYKIKKINSTYNETSNGELLAIFNSAGLLEIALNKGNIAELLNINLHATIRIKFFE